MENLTEEEKITLYKISVNNTALDDIHLAFLSVASVMSISIILGNVTVLLLFYQERRHFKMAHKYVLSMALSDLFTGAVSIPIQMNMFDKRIAASDVACPLNMSLVSHAILISLTVLTASGVDRFWAIIFPLHYRCHSEPWIANCIITLSWVVSASLAITQFALVNPPKYEHTLCVMVSETYNKTLFFFVLMVFMPINIIIIITSYVIIFISLVRRFKARNESHYFAEMFKVIFHNNTTKENEPRNIGALKERDVRTAMLLLFTVTLSLLAFIPCIVSGIVMVVDVNLMPVEWMLMVYLLMTINSVFNPILYAFNIPNIRMALKKLVGRITGKHVAEESFTAAFTSGVKKP